MITIAPLDHRVDAWDALVSAEVPDTGTFCHLAGWREVMSDVLGHETHYLVAVDPWGTWRGALPLVRVRSRLFGDYLVSLPFLNSGGPVGNARAARALVLHALALARRLRVDLLELRTRRALPETSSPPVPLSLRERGDAGDGLRLSYRKTTVLLPLEASPDLLWHRFSSKLRSQVRRAEREGFEARFGPEQLEPFYEVFSRHMCELGTPVLPRALFERVARLFPELVVFGVVYHGAEPVAAGCGFAWRGEFEITWAGDLLAWRRAAPNMLLYWECMRRMIERGVRTFNFGRCTPGGGTHRFKLQWGGVDAPLPWVQWAPGAARATPSPDRPVYRLAARAWRHLPLVLANMLGPVLARRLP